MSIEEDYKRFNKILKGKVRDNLKDFINDGKRVVKKGNNEYVVPMPNIDTPRFKKNFKNQEGVGQGDGKEGDVLGDGKGQEKPGQGKAGNTEGDKAADAVFSAQELAKILGEELELPKIKPKGKPIIQKTTNKYKTIGPVGPNSLKHFKKTFKETIKREASLGTEDFSHVFPIKKDERYRVAKPEIVLDNSAVVIYIMDVSGSMGDEQKEIVRNTSFWLNTWLKSNYKNLDIRFIIHDSTAKEVDEESFFSTKESGGTVISSSYKLVKDIVEKEYLNWNIYMFQFSDGDTWSGQDSKECRTMLKEFFLKYVNLFCYGNVFSKYGTSQYLKDLEGEFSLHEDVILAEMKSSKDIIPTIKKFLGKGK